jgi:hypothetical protein
MPQNLIEANRLMNFISTGAMTVELIFKYFQPSIDQIKEQYVSLHIIWLLSMIDIGLEETLTTSGQQLYDIAVSDDY